MVALARTIAFIGVEGANRGFPLYEEVAFAAPWLAPPVACSVGSQFYWNCATPVAWSELESPAAYPEEGGEDRGVPRVRRQPI
jgi:hypothetical protein